MSTPGVHYDFADQSAPDAPSQHGAVVIEHLPEERSRLFRVKYWCSIDVYNKSVNREDYDSRGPKGTAMEGHPLVETSAATDLGGGVCEFERTYAEIPKKRLGPREGTTFGYQGVFHGTFYQISSNVSASVLYTYFFTARPENIPCASLPRLGSIPGFTGPDDILFQGGLAEAESVSVWKGHIYVKTTKTVPPLVFTAV